MKNLASSTSVLYRTAQDWAISDKKQINKKMNENQTKKEKKAFYIIKLVQEDHGKLSIFHDIHHFLSLKKFQPSTSWFINIGDLISISFITCLKITSVWGKPRYLETTIWRLNVKYLFKRAKCLSRRKTMCISVESGEKNIETELNINVSYFIQDFQSSQLKKINIFRC